MSEDRDRTKTEKFFVTKQNRFGRVQERILIVDAASMELRNYNRQCCVCDAELPYSMCPSRGADLLSSFCQPLV